MEKVLEDLPTKSNLPAPIYPINLQKGTFNSVEALVHSLSSNMGSWLKQIVESVDEVSFKAANLVDLVSALNLRLAQLHLTS